MSKSSENARDVTQTVADVHLVIVCGCLLSAWLLGDVNAAVAQNVGDNDLVGGVVKLPNAFDQLDVFRIPCTATTAVFSPNGRWLVTSSLEGKVTFWNVETGRRHREHSLDPGSSVMRFSADGKSLTRITQRTAKASTWLGIELIHESGATTKFSREFLRNGSAHRTLDLSPSLKHLAVSQSSKDIHIVNVASDKVIQTVTGHARIENVVFSIDGKRLLSTDAKGNACLWNVQTGKRILSRQIDGSVSGVGFLPDGSAIVEIRSGKIYPIRWNLRTGKPLHLNLSGPFAAAASYIPFRRSAGGLYWPGWQTAWSPENKTVARWTGFGPCLGGGLIVQKVGGKGDDGAMLVYGQVSGTGPVEFSRDGSLIAALVEMGTTSLPRQRWIGIWKTDSWQPWLRIQTPDQPNDFAFSPDGRSLAIVGTEAVWLWRGMHKVEVSRIRGHWAAITALDFSRGGGTLASTSLDGSVCLWRVTSGKQLRKLTAHDQAVTCVAFSPDGRTLATGSEDKTVRLWSRFTGQQLRTLRVPTYPAESLTFSPDGTLLAAIGQTPTLWEISTGAEVWEWASASSANASAAAFTSVGTAFFTGYSGSRLQLWETTTGKRISELRTKIPSANRMAFAPGGQSIAHVPFNKSGTIRLRDCVTGELLATFSGLKPPVRSMTFSADGRLFAAGSMSDGAVIVWDVTTSQQRAQLAPAASGVSAIRLSSDGKRLAIGRMDARIEVRDLSFKADLKK